MALWTKVLSGFDAEDETVNFGTRAVAENDGSIYETCTRATIQPEIQVLNNPNVLASFHHSMLCVAIDKSITIFAEESCQDIIANIGFDTIITAYCLSTDGHFLYISVESGELHGFHLTMGGRQIFSVDFKSKFRCESILHLSLKETSNVNDLIVVTKDGRIFQIKEVDANPADQSITEDQMNIKLVAEVSGIFGVALAEGNSTDEFSLVTFGDELALWPQQRSYSMKNLRYRYKKIQFFDDYRSAVCLRSDGSLSLLCLRALVGWKIGNESNIADFVTVKEESQGPHHMLVLLKPKDDEKTTNLHLVSFPDFQIKFSISVASTTYLVGLFNSFINNLVFLEGICNSSGVVDLIKVKAIEESVPDLRLQRLLRRHEFAEAHDFAKKFHLDVESVFHAEAVMLMNRLRPRIYSTEIVEVDVFIKTLEKVQDVRFIHECCNKAFTKDYKDTRRLLTYSRQRIVDFINSQEHHDEDLAKLLGNMSVTLRKLETFEIIHNFNTTEDSTDEWIKFSGSNLLEECLRYLSQGELNAAALIWIRHTPSIAENVSEGTVTKILGAIPENLSPEELWPWLRHFIPSVTSFYPGGLSEIIQWGYKKTKSLEKFHRELWPNIGLEFSEGLIELLSFDEYNVCYQFHQQYANKNSQLQRLIKLMQAMSDLAELKSHYKVSLPLTTYLGNPIDVIHLLLDKIHTDWIPGFLENFLQQYMLNHSLQNDQVLSSYVQNILRNSKGWWLWRKAPWDKRVSVVIEYIHNIQNRLEQTFEVLKKAPVPWSEAMVNLAENSYVYDHPLVAKIRRESESVAVKLILKKYGFAREGLCSKLFSNIIKQDRSSMIEDIFELTKINHHSRLNVFSQCLNFHLNRGDINRTMEVMNQLPEDIVLHCCEQIIHVFKSQLKFMSAHLENYVEILGTIESRLEKILSKSRERSIKWVDTLNEIPHLRTMYRLKKEFNFSVSSEDYYSDKEQVLENFISKLIETNENSEAPENPEEMLKKIKRITALLEVPELAGVRRLFDMTKNSAILKSHLSSRLNQYELLMPGESSHLNKICSDLVMEVENDRSLANSLKKFCSENLVDCSLQELPGILLCKKQVDAYNEAIGQIDEEETQQNSSESTKSWSLYKIYEDASISSGNILLPILRDCLIICSHYRDMTEYNLQHSTAQSNAIKQMSQKMLGRVREIQNEHHDFALLKIIATIDENLSAFLPESEESVVEMRSVLSHCVSTMLKKVVGSFVFDVQLGLVCLFMIPETDSLKSLASAAKLFQADHKKDRIVKNLGYEFCRLTNNSLQMEKFDIGRILHQWARRLVKYGISHREVLNSNTEMKRDILQRIMVSKQSDIIEVLNDFCQSFGFDRNDVFLSYLRILLCSWQPKFNMSSLDGLKDPKIDESDVNQLASKCKNVSAQIEDKVALKTHLSQLTSKINFYHYEIFLIILDLGEEKEIEIRSILCFFKNYNRVGLPTDDELEEWANLTQENQSLPPISKWRLPFLPKVSQYKLIQPELNLKTYEKWLSIAPVLKISNHNICSLAVKGAVTEAWKKLETNSSSWSIYPRNSALLKDIEKCISYMKGPEGHYYATAALYYVVNHTPPGADQVAAARLCFTYAKSWQQQDGDTQDLGQDKRDKIEEKYLKYTSKHILHTHGLGVEKYLSLVDYPEQLVRSLYKDESIPQRYRNATKTRSDINGAVNELGTIFPLNLMKIKLELLQEWLQPESSEMRNESITIGVYQDVSSSSAETFNTDDNLLRACYIVGSGTTESFAVHLISIGFDDKEDCHGPGVRFRALRVLQSIIDEATLQDYTKIEPRKFNEYMKSLQYLTELQKLGIGYSVSGFETCSKQKLIQVLLNSRFCTPKALALVPQLFLDFEIEDYGLFNLALEKMAQLSLVKELRKTLSMLGSMDRLITYSGYIDAWQIVISDPFNKLDARSDPQSIEACMEALRSLHACPVVDKIQFEDIVDTCFRARQIRFAAALLPFLKETEKQMILQRIMKDEQFDSLKAELSDLVTRGIIIVRQSIMMLEEVNTSRTN